MSATVRSFVHRFVTRPLQILVPPLGDRLYDLTSPARRHPTVAAVRYSAMFERDPAGGVRVRNAISTGRLTGFLTPSGDRVSARRLHASTPVQRIPGEGARRPVASPKADA